jgi:cyclopropane fatty-acyl-phospholipid synthase-like methyltransferase
MSSETHASPSPQRKIEYLSRPAEVSMADSWFDLAALDHFWIRRRFQVLQKLCDNLIQSSRELAEIGCGHGLLQRQVEESYQRQVAGFDLNDYALQLNVSRQSPVYCYDIFQKSESLRGRFDLIFLFDVLEHITEEDPFLQAVLFHLAPGGSLVVNVPAGQWAFSKYDEAAGHVRRYSINKIRQTAERNGLALEDWSYWGLPLIPTLMVRRLWLMGQQDKSKIISTGFDSRSPWVNKSLGTLSKCEWLPQRLIGTSLMAILRHGSNRNWNAR